MYELVKNFRIWALAAIKSGASKSRLALDVGVSPVTIERLISKPYEDIRLHEKTERALRDYMGRMDRNGSFHVSKPDAGSKVTDAELDAVCNKAREMINGDQFIYRDKGVVKDDYGELIRTINKLVARVPGNIKVIIEISK